MSFKGIKSIWQEWRVHRRPASFSSLSETKKKDVLRVEANEFVRKYGDVINTLANE